MDYVQKMCKLKAKIANNIPKKFTYPILTADTTVCINHQILSKPKSYDDNRDMLNI